jgi:hypothetical protein
MSDASQGWNSFEGFGGGGFDLTTRPSAGREIVENGMNGFPDREDEESGREDDGQQGGTGQTKSRVEPKNGNQEDEKVDQRFEDLFTDNGTVRGQGAIRATSPEGESHFKLGNQLIVIHIYGNLTGNGTAGLYLPQGFQRPVFVGGSAGTVYAMGKDGKSVLVFNHVIVSSQKELNRNYNSGKKNKAGSRYIGQTGGTGGTELGYRHSHISYFVNMSAWSTVVAYKKSFADPKLEHSKYFIDLRRLLR